jgi:hypothetical protein
VQRDNDGDRPSQGAGGRGRDRDRAIEHVLRQVSAAAPADDRACVDGETLAAWTEGRIRGAEADAVERHLSTCARCQQMLAAFARTAPPPVVEVPLWRRWRLQWLVPIATAATVAAMWVATPQEQRDAYVAPRAASQAARVPEPVPSDAPAQAPPAGIVQRQDRDANSVRENQANGPERKRVSPPLAPAAPAAKTREELERRVDDANTSVDFQKAQPAPATAAETDTRGRDVAGLRAQTESAQTAAPAAAAPAPQTAPPSAGEPRERRAASSALGGATLRQFVAALEIVSPNPSNRWRITGGRQVEHTTDGGAQWAAVTLLSTGPLTAGTAPAPSICWIVGRSGAIFLTTDGSRFVRIPFSEPLDLISVTATDDQRATVTSSDGRTFTTADRGMTWTAGRP